jgi:hypothetical protein
MIESLTATHRHQYLHAIVQLLAVFTKSESGKKRLEADEERFLDDVLLVLRILLHLIDGCLTVEAAILNDVTDTVMAIVEILLPLLTPDVLSVININDSQLVYNYIK